ncbi:hypothetical protein CLV35_1421 [Motilibacter peucedani]|uniref:LemA protein n=1 Tax=Motilibacter peucedani TaxID=598650 RepID=A0A420XS63_9ACTN|nr:hypothetical protein [Motilibacter peucedani]RKS77723.1 hypothetical protein CLV35_1421 [Motilibacter peucedani]
MPALEELAALVVLAGVLAWYLTYTAGRLDRLHGRVEGARAALDAQLVRRATVTLELAGSGLLDPASSVLLADAAHSARVAGDAERELAESNLSQTLRAALDDDAVQALREEEGGDEVLADLAACAMRVRLARRFLNDAVRATGVVRAQRVVRWARLAGRAAAPAGFEMDDEPPPALEV